MNELMMLQEWVTANMQAILVAIIVLVFITLLVFININIKLAKMNKRYQQLMQGVEGANLEKLLLAHIEEVKDTSRKVAALDRSCQELQHITKACVQKVGIVRFNAFEDTGSDLSFAIALLDAKDNGVVVSSIFGRNESRTYAKPLENRQSTYFLSEEEQEAIKLACTTKS